jgi:hypothetical protein
MCKYIGHYDRNGGTWQSERGRVTLTDYHDYHDADNNGHSHTDVCLFDASEAPTLLWRATFTWHTPRSVVMGALSYALDSIGALVPVDEVKP